MNDKYSSLRFFGTVIALLLAALGGLLAYKHYLSPQRPGQAEPPAARSTDSVAVWFTDPTAGGSLDKLLVQAVESAQTSVDLAVYSLTLRSLTDALLAAQERGVTVRVVLDSDSLDAAQPQRLKEAGVPLLGDNRPGLMHNKFMVIDGYEVWTGSPNFTVSGTSSDNNNLLRLRSQAAAQDYTAEFNEMFEQNLFGPDLLAETPYPRFTIGDTAVEVYFSPDDGAEARLLELVRGARSSIDLLAYTYTSQALTQALLERAAAGVRVRGVFDTSQNQPGQNPQVEALRQAGLEVRLDGIPGLMHDKVLIVDGQTVQSGSYNYTYSAGHTNDENMVILRDPALAEQYAAEFEKIYGLGSRDW